MYGIDGKKSLNLMILKILEEHSNAQKRLTQKNIIEFLEKDYGVTCDRRTVKANLVSLEEMNYKVNLSGGIFIKRDFEDSELRMLIDSVLFSKNISHAQAKKLIKKLQALGSDEFNAKVNHIANLPEIYHSDNNRVMSNLDVLNDSISKKKKVTFTYNKYDTNFKLKPREKSPYVVSPYQMVATYGRYYLICNTDGHDNISHYRIDKMTEVQMLKQPIKPKKQIKDFVQGVFNLPQHMAEHIYMFGGESIWVKFWAEDYITDGLVDWFGKSFQVLKKADGKNLIQVKVNETAMKFWAMQYGESIEIIAPNKLRQTIMETAQKIMVKHQI